MSESETTTRLSCRRLAELFGMPERTLNTVLRTAGLNATKGYDPMEAARAAIAWALKKMAGADSERAKDQARLSRSEADMSEMDRGQKARTLCFRDDYRSNYADAIAQGVRNISRLKTLTKAQKEQVFTAIRDVKLAPIVEEK